ncbi:hypothetical protein FisN_30Hh081 [Fistulifera solaris]|uniref:Mitochondrial ribonuclease P catalytic subunit n=1 Tax=Fistulifera solaris TaxID=1519565 RepID=A0A1Z5K6J9_FISSO|nr:hypothetical protein FisN_30Hh081 [Fistulifera solaris]|eukprot:GAX21880.1 hypothetical protein FisN_30Hh081 [Fistulifera solaris]
MTDPNRCSSTAGQKRPAKDSIIETKKPKIGNKKVEPDVLAFRRLVQDCCSNNDLLKAIKAYEEACQSSLKIEAQSFYNLLSLCDGLGQRSLHVGTPKATQNNSQSAGKGKPTTQPFPDAVVDLETRLNYAKRLYEHMQSLGFPLTETAYSALIKVHLKVQDTTRAEELLAEAEQVAQCKPKLRLYSATLLAYCHEGDLGAAVRVWHRLSQQGLVLSEKEYVNLLQCATATGNARVFERVLSDLAEDILVPCQETCQAIRSWFQSEFAILPEAFAEKNDTIHRWMQEIQPHAEPAVLLGPVQCHTHWDVSENVGINPSSGKLLSGCLQDAPLRPVELSSMAWAQMKEMNETIASSGKLENDTSDYQGGRKGRKKTVLNTGERQQCWKQFTDYLSRRLSDGQTIDVVIDGANVGYFETNFPGSPKHVDYHQINWAVQHFLEQGKSVLLVMHCRHFARHFMPESVQPLVQRWMDHGLLYQTPRDMNDDWFWMQAALVAGPGTLVLTNDEMRDHHFQMLAPRSFLRWKDRHQVHFQLGAWKHDGKERRRELILTYPEIYSRRIQRVEDGLVVPLVKRGDVNRFLDGAFVAEDFPPEETYMCIRPAKM